MRCVVLVKADQAGESGALPSEQELVDAGVFRVVEGPFPATRELRVQEERIRAQVAAHK